MKNSSYPPVYVIVAVRNGEEVIGKTLQSLLGQTHGDFQCLIYNDASSDRTKDIIHGMVGEDVRFRLFGGSTQVWPAEARWKCLQRIKKADPKALVVLLDGDDWLSHEEVLAYLVRTYYHSLYLSGHGNYQTDAGEVCDWSRDYPVKVKQQLRYREYPWVATHLRWFRAGLKNYLPYAVLLDEEGQPFKTATDFALFLPLLELSGKHTAYCDEVLYVYNQRGGASMSASRKAAQKQAEIQIRSKPMLRAINPEQLGMY